MPPRDPSELPAVLRALPAAAPLLRAIAAGGVGEEVYLVGGAVRDLWLGGAPLDLDVAVVGDVGALAGRLGVGRAHGRFGTATAWGPDGARYDLARTRRETYARPGALPDVAPAGIDSDLARRDFTVNAIALGLGGPRRGELVAARQALADLDAGRLRILHPDSFHDDPTRLLRLARYAGRLGFTVDARTAARARDAAGGGALATVSGPRIGRELELLAAEADPVAGFQALGALGIDAGIAPGFGLGGGDGALVGRALGVLAGADGDQVAMVLGLAARGVGDRVAPGDATALLSRFGLTAARRDAALAVARDAPALAGALVAARAPSQVDAALGRAPVEAVAVAAARLEAAGDAPVAARAVEWLRDGRHAALEISGADLIAAGVTPGPGIAAGLRAARAAHLDGRAGTREAQLAEALRAAGARH